MKVKVRRRKPAPVAAEQALKKYLNNDFLLNDAQNNVISMINAKIRKDKAILRTYL